MAESPHYLGVSFRCPVASVRSMANSLARGGPSGSGGNAFARAFEALLSLEGRFLDRGGIGEARMNKSSHTS